LAKKAADECCVAHRWIFQEYVLQGLWGQRKRFGSLPELFGKTVKKQFDIGKMDPEVRLPMGKIVVQVASCALLRRAVDECFPSAFEAHPAP
jgi:hypothetical protein